MKYMAVDPGERTWAYSIVDIKIVKNELKIKVLASEYVDDTLVNLTHNSNHKIGKFIHDAVDVELPIFGKAIDRLLKLHNPERVGVERFQTRGIKGKAIETVSMMNALLLDRASKRKIMWYLYVAATWKNWIARLGKDKTFLDELYKIGDVRALAHHTVDTVCMAIWMFMQENPEAPITKDKLRNAIRGTKLG